jgi:hypothetical protein
MERIQIPLDYEASVDAGIDVWSMLEDARRLGHETIEYAITEHIFARKQEIFKTRFGYERPTRSSFTMDDMEAAQAVDNIELEDRIQEEIIAENEAEYRERFGHHSGTVASRPYNLYRDWRSKFLLRRHLQTLNRRLKNCIESKVDSILMEARVSSMTADIDETHAQLFQERYGFRHTSSPPYRFCRETISPGINPTPLQEFEAFKEREGYKWGYKWGVKQREKKMKKLRERAESREIERVEDIERKRLRKRRREAESPTRKEAKRIERVEKIERKRLRQIERKRRREAESPTR